MIKVGIIQKDFCYIGTLDEVNKVPSSNDIECVYIDLANGSFLVALKSELIYLNVATT